MSRLKKMIEQNPKKFKKALIFSLLTLFLGALVFFPNVAFADGLLENDLYAREVSQFIDIISHVVYVFIWPCLAIAGAALDNSLIYGSFLHLDAALRNIWNIMKNFANFTLGFIFIFTIVKNLFAGSFGSSNYDPVKGAKDTVVKTLIAGVLVQMSWFIVAVLIDLSTILIYAVGGIPLSMLGVYDNHVVLDMPIMKLNTEFDSKNISYYYSYGGHNYSTCLLANKGGDAKDKITLQGLDGEYIAGRKYLYMSDGTTFETGYCVLNGYLYKYEESSGFFCDPGNTGCYTPASGESIYMKNSGYLNQLQQYLVNLDSGHAVGERDSCFLVRAYNFDYDTGSCQPICSGYGEVSYTGDVFSGGFKLENLMENSKGLVGPFITMYSSILNYQDLVIDPGNESAVGKLFGLLINTFFALVLFIPIAILMVLLIIRIGYLWVVVAISPILILVNYGPLGDKLKNNEILQKFSPKEIITKIFSPVIVVFTVSLCIVFLSTIFKSKPNKSDESQVLSAFGIEKIESTSALGETGSSSTSNATGCTSSGIKNVGTETYSILGLVTVKINAQNYNHGKSMFAWVLVELLATGMVWVFLKFAISMMGKTGKKLADTAEEFVKSVPIIPLPGGQGAVGINKLKDMSSAAILQRYSRDMDKQSEDNLRAAFPWAYPGTGGPSPQQSSSSSTVSSDSINKVVTEIKDKGIKKYDDLSDTSKATLTAMYGTSAQSNYNNFVSYYITNATANKAVIDAGSALSSSSATAPTNIDALNFVPSDLADAIKYDSNWMNWARSMKGKFVELKDGVYVVSEDGTSLQTMQDYEKANFAGKELKNITQSDYTGWPADKQQLLKTYLQELEEEITELDALVKKETDEGPLKGTDASKKASLVAANLPSQATVQGYRTTLGITS